jgi:inactive STAND
VLLETEIKGLEGTEIDNAPARDWRIYLPKLNFKEAVAIAEELLLKRTENSAALFLVSNNIAMGGKWCVSRIRDLLQDTTADFQPFVLECTGTHQFDEKWILESLGQYLNVRDLPTNPTEAAQKIIKTLRQSIRSGSVRFLEIRGWEFIHDFSEILTWFVRDFWIPLTKELIAIEGQHRRVRLVAIIIADEPLPDAALPAALLCSREDFEVEKLLELPLQNWSRQEIDDWLEAYLQLSSDEIKKLSRKIYSASNSGLPSLVHDALAQNLRS